MFREKISRKAAVAANKNTREKEYWLNRFSGDIEKTTFPYDYKRTHDQEPQMDCIPFNLPTAAIEKITRLSGASDYKRHMILLANVLVLLANYSGSSDLIVGVPVYKQETEKELVNTVLALRQQLEPATTFKELLQQVRLNLLEALDYQNYPIQALLDRLDLPAAPGEFPLFDVAILFENIHLLSYIQHTRPNLVFSFSRRDDKLTGIIQYNAQLYNKSTLEQIIRHLNNTLVHTLTHPGTPLAAIEILSEEDKNRLLFDFNDTDAAYPADKTLHQLVEEQVEQAPYRVAVVYGDQSVTYRLLDQEANRLAHYLSSRFKCGSGNNGLVGLLMDKSIFTLIAVLGILKAGAAYVPIDPLSPEKRIISAIDDGQLRILLSEKKYIKTLNGIQWECPSLHIFLCMDSRDIYSEEEAEKSGLMDKKLWEYVGESGGDDITAGGWTSSYTGNPIPARDMDEYGDNVLKKLTPYLNRQVRILEIGCATGISMYRLVPHVGFYHGTDLSSVIIEKNKQRVKQEGYSHVKLSCLPAHDIDRLEEKDFDIVIMNSVIQHFHGHNYLRKVITKAVQLLAAKGRLFVGDVMDLERKEALIKDLEDFKAANHDKRLITKTDWSAELFVSRGFFEDLAVEIPAIQRVDISEKIRTIENELTKFRCDVLMTIDKTEKTPLTGKVKHKYQEDASVMQPFSTEKVPGNPSHPCSPAYVIYTSGTTGRPKGVVLEHRNLVRLFVNDRNLFDFGRDDVWTMFHMYNFDFSVWEMYGALLFGGKLIVIPRTQARDTELYLALLKKEKVSVLNQTPSAFYNLISEELKHTGTDLKTRYVIFGGEALNPAKLKEWYNRYPYVRLINMFGITETTVHVTYKVITPKEIASGTSNIGTPIPTLTTYVVDKKLGLSPPGVPGELCVGGKGVARGYLNNSDLTAEKFFSASFIPGTGQRIERLYRSGDQVRQLENGEMEYLGRIDRQVKIRGFRMELAEIENQLLTHAAVKEVVVTNYDYGEEDKRLVAYIVPDTDSAFVVQQLLLLEKRQQITSKSRYQLPNGMTLFYLNRSESDFMYREIFEEQCYLKYDITLPDHACVFDVGANIGLFSLFAHQVCHSPKIYAFEPIPQVFEMLSLNTSIHGLDITLFDYALSAEEGESLFTYYPNASIMSSRFARADEEFKLVETFMRNSQLTDETADGVSEQQLNELIEERLSQQQVKCRMKTISQVIAEQEIETIDLLKIDVEKSEADVLNGIAAADWSRIRQLVLEVHDTEDRLKQVTQLLENRGYSVEIEQNSGLSNTPIYNLYARFPHTCPNPGKAPDSPAGETPPPTWTSPEQLLIDLQKYLKDKLPEYMIPPVFMLLTDIPLTANGKINHKRLPDPRTPSIVREASYQPPTDEQERAIVQIWAEVLQLDARKIGVQDNFFELGGNSLSILKVKNRFNEIFNYEVSLSNLFLYPTVKELAASIYQDNILNRLECIVKLNIGKSKRNLFILHPLHGMVYPYKKLASLLEEHFTVYGIQSRGLARKSKLPDDGEEFLYDYLHQIISLQPEGPYYIGGYCVGSPFSYALVQMMEDLGCDIEKLILIDETGFIRKPYIRFLQLEAAKRKMVQKAPGFLKRVLRKTLTFQYDANDVRDRLKSRSLEWPMDEGLSDDMEARKDVIYKNIWKILTEKTRYKRLINSPLLVIQALEKEKILRFDIEVPDEVVWDIKTWRKMTSAHLKIVHTPGNHDSIFEEPYVERLADAIINHT